MISRRQFTFGLAALSAGSTAFSGLANAAGAYGDNHLKTAPGFGKLTPDPRGLLDLPEGFSYKIISQLGDPMSDGLHVPDKADGMGCFRLDDDRVVLVRNHELKPGDLARQHDTIASHKTIHAFDTNAAGTALPGGTSNIVYNMVSGEVETQFISLCGTIRNCSGGITPWNTWLTCEESVALPSAENDQPHGWVFEVPAAAESLIAPEPLKAMGRFNHEAAAVDPESGIVYMTEDRGDSLFYRFIPHVPGKLAEGGRLQALVIKAKTGFDSRNWSSVSMPVQQWYDAEWVDLENPESPQDDLRQRGYADGAALFARGEGIHWGVGELYFCCTNGGNKQLGQIMRYQPSAAEGTANEKTQPGRIQLFLESTDKALFNFGDNLTVAPFGDLIVCEDQYTDIVDNHLRGVTPEGHVYNFARLRTQTELAGACFSPDGSTLFVNLYAPTKTLAITGPWATRS